MASPRTVSQQLPPYFAAVALTSTLLCGVLAGVQLYGEHAQVAETTEATGGAASDREEVAAPPTRAYRRTFTSVKLRHEMVVEGSPLGRKRIRRRLRALRDAVSAIEQAGRQAGFYLADLDTGACVSYAADQDFYPASSIKGPYVASVYERLVDTGKLKAEQVDPLARPIIIDSDNDAYHALLALCGSSVFADWAADCGAIERDSAQYQDFSTRYYPRVTPRQMALMWEHLHTYLGDASGSGPKLEETFAQRVESPLRAGLPGDLTTIAKAGWYPADAGEEYAATVDAGLVANGEHTYVVVIMTTLPDDLGGLAELVPGFWEARRTLG